MINCTITQSDSQCRRSRLPPVNGFDVIVLATLTRFLFVQVNYFVYSCATAAYVGWYTVSTYMLCDLYIEGNLVLCLNVSDTSST